MREGVEEGGIALDELEVVFTECIAVDLRDIGGEEVEGVEAGELGVDDGFGGEGGREG